ncbi:MAG: hypothetical protein HRU18_06720 [Pseudoalteromonas sp.]|uniref:hypothetical protein n=1 Tax=Pseudoalteromonas sp. TaxID=53249 RepID=UPI001D1F6A95|nr:hypothetical protein [Pseudoalteromonas sp.]NRA77883.1 hypothetical protein [Pseudoalteromonas sp.]
MKVLMAASTQTDSEIIVITHDGFVSLAQRGLSGSETVKLQIDLDDEWVDIAPPLILSATSNYMQVAGPATYRVVKPASSAPVTVYIER